MRNFLTLCALVASSAIVYAQAPVAPQDGQGAPQPQMSAPVGGPQMNGDKSKGPQMQKTATREEALKIINEQLSRVNEMQAKLADHEARLQSKLAEVTAAAQGSEVDLSGIMLPPPHRQSQQQGQSRGGQSKGFGAQGGQQQGGQTPPPPPAQE